MTDEAPTCDRSDCDRPAAAVYEGDVPPDGTFRFNACDDCAPDAPPVRELD